MTATPDRGDMRNLGQYFESLAYEYTLPKAIKEGYLTPIKALTIPLKIDMSGVSVQAGDFKASDIGTRKLTLSGRNRTGNAKNIVQTKRQSYFFHW